MDNIFSDGIRFLHSIDGKGIMEIRKAVASYIRRTEQSYNQYSHDVRIFLDDMKNIANGKEKVSDVIRRYEYYAGPKNK